MSRNKCRLVNNSVQHRRQVNLSIAFFRYDGFTWYSAAIQNSGYHFLLADHEVFSALPVKNCVTFNSYVFM